MPPDSPTARRRRPLARAGTAAPLPVAIAAGVPVARPGRSSAAAATAASTSAPPAVAVVGTSCRRGSARVCASIVVGHDWPGNERVRAGATARGWTWWHDVWPLACLAPRAPLRDDPAAVRAGPLPGHQPPRRATAFQRDPARPTHNCTDKLCVIRGPPRVSSSAPKEVGAGAGEGRAGARHTSEEPAP